jgi:hypothetical protein
MNIDNPDKNKNLIVASFLNESEGELKNTLVFSEKELNLCFKIKIDDKWQHFEISSDQYKNFKMKFVELLKRQKKEEKETEKIITDILSKENNTNCKNKADYKLDLKVSLSRNTSDMRRDCNRLRRIINNWKEGTELYKKWLESDEGKIVRKCLMIYIKFLALRFIVTKSYDFEEKHERILDHGISSYTEEFARIFNIWVKILNLDEESKKLAYTKWEEGKKKEDLRFKKMIRHNEKTIKKWKKEGEEWKKEKEKNVESVVLNSNELEELEK